MLRDGALLLTPVAGLAPPAPDDTAGLRDAVMPYTTPQNLTGFPACSVRAGFDENGLPTAVQITGAPWSEAGVLRAARAICDATPDVQDRRPPLGSADQLSSSSS
jgi:aspartyl-tRNA(Asn)/glutamyl-tRNA(Gln) amidotransferase subunit A